MHELSIIEGVLDMVRDNARVNNITKVSKITLVIGKLTMVLPDSLQFCFEVLKNEDDLLHGAVLEIEEQEVVVWCPHCEKQSTLSDSYAFSCPACGAVGVDVITGRELFLSCYEGDGN